MLTANLLPPEEKEFIKFEEYRRMMCFYGGGIALVLMFGLTLLIPSYVFLSTEKMNLKEEDVIEAALAQKLKLEETFSSATFVAALLVQIRTFVGNPSHASGLIKTFLVDESGIRIDALSITSGGDVALSGFAQTRDDLLDFQKGLQDSQMLDSITFPISDIIRSADLNFTMQGKLKAGRGLY